MNQFSKVRFLIIFFEFLRVCSCKYVEGRLKTNDNWAFLARFCFLSDEGEFSYLIDYNDNQGDINLLLYYDTDDQWPAVYKSNKTCEERESVLNLQQNQIVNLTARDARASEFSGCNYRPQFPLITTTPAPLYTINIPTPKRSNFGHTTKKGSVTIKTTPTTIKFITTTAEAIQSTTLQTEPSDETTFTNKGTINEDFASTTNVFETTSSSTDDLVSTTTEFTVEVETTETTPKPEVASYQKSPIKKRSVPLRIPVQPKPLRRGRFVNCHNARRFRSSRERWWFIAVSNCHGNGIDLNYQLLMTNGAPGDYWHEHFSADEFYVLPILMTFSIAYSFLMLGITVCSLELKQRQLLHTTYKIYVISCVVQLLGIMLMSIVYMKMAVSGRTSSTLKRFANMLLGASETCFLLLLLLLAKGFTITRGRLSLKGTVKLTIFMCLYITTYLSIFVYEGLVFDPGEVLYLYESPAGYGLIILRLCAWFMFIYSTVFTLKKYPEKSNFYYPFNLFGTLWFVAGPAFIISANTYIDKWVRESVVCAVLLFIAFGGHLMFLVLTMPSVANKNFPYHVRTTQIGIMEVAGTIEHFGHHVYEPSMAIREHTVIIPLTRRTEEIFEGMYNQKRFSRPQITELPDENPSNENSRDLAMENVFKWSMAKNIPALDFPEFDRTGSKRDSIGWATADLTDTSFQNGVNTRRPSLTNQLTVENQNDAANYDDLIGHVPIELFTVSKVAEGNDRNGSIDRH